MQQQSGVGWVKTWNFDAESPEATPSGFWFSQTGGGAGGRWVVRAAKDAPSGDKVLVQAEPDSTEERYPLAVVKDIVLRDVRLSARCKTVSGRVDQVCGLLFRYQDMNNYYLVRASALQNNVRLYRVQNGQQHQIGQVGLRIVPDHWFQLRVEAKLDHIEVFWNAVKVFATNDKSLRSPGRVGLWSKADSITYYDDLSVAPLP